MNYEFVPLQTEGIATGHDIEPFFASVAFPFLWINFMDTLKSSLIILQIYGMRVKIEREKEEIQDDLRDAKNDFSLSCKRF